MTTRRVREIAQAVQEGKLHPVSVVQEYLDRIARLDSKIGAFRQVWAEEAVERAKDLASRGDLGQLPLAGVPFALKDNTSLSNEFVQILVDAGAIPVGATYSPQFCTWGTTTAEEYSVDNPVFPGHTPGGSSGGSAAAVAADMVPFAQGNDGMGSLRIPAACCGLSTLKATPGALPGRMSGTEWYGMSIHGILAQDNDDLMLITSVLTGGYIDAANRDLPEHFSVLLDIVSPVFGITATEDYTQAARQAAQVFSAAGISVTETRMPYPRNPVPMLARWTAGVADELRYGPTPDRVEWRNRVHAALGQVLRRTIRTRQVVRDRARIEKALQGDQILITPALATAPPRNRAWHNLPWLMNLISNMKFTPYMSTWNYLGFPAGIVIEPNTGLPVQVIARPTQERIVLSAMERIAVGCGDLSR